MINYKNLADSVEYYKECGYCPIEVPWTVSEYVDNITKPADRIHYQLKHNNKCLVASGEQGFLYLYLKDYLPKGKFQTITPCFRDEPYDLFHEKCFMKNELIITDDTSDKMLNKIIDDARGFFAKIIGCPMEELEIVNVSTDFEISLDINFKNIELGSYGIRETEFLKWIYGTGCAEPRLSKCKDIWEKSQAII